MNKKDRLFNTNTNNKPNPLYNNTFNLSGFEIIFSVFMSLILLIITSVISIDMTTALILILTTLIIFCFGSLGYLYLKISR